MDIDLNLDNYDLDDILSLFKISYDFDIHDLKKAKKIVLKTHPDKCNLSKEYFLFFSSAYKILFNIHQFRTKSNGSHSTEYIVEKDSAKEKLLQSFLKKKNFNKLFNEMFEKHYIHAKGTENGYGEWLKSNEDLDFRETTKANMHETFEQKKKETKELVMHTGIKEMCSSSGCSSDLVDDCPENYGSDIFSSFQYEDLRKAHQESVVPVSKEDFYNKPLYKNETELLFSRQDAKPLDKTSAIEWLKTENNAKDKIDLQRAYKLAKQDEKTQQMNDLLMAKFKTLTYS